MAFQYFCPASLNTAFIPALKGEVFCRIFYKREIKYLGKGEWEKLRDSIDNFRNMVLIELLYESGCRVGEVVLMKIEDIDFEAGFVRIPAENTKTKTARTVYIPQGILSKVRAYLKQTRRKKGLFFRLTKRRTQQNSPALF